MDYNFFIVGGDKRNLLLAKKLSKNVENVNIFGFNRINEEFFVNNRIKNIKTTQELFTKLYQTKNSVIIGPIPYSIDGKTLYMPFNDEKININLLKNKKIIAGKIPNEILNNEDVDILKDEAFTIKNTLPTVEGAIAKAIELTDINIANANVLVLGFGRVGKILCYKLKQMGANVYAEARKEKDLAWIEVYGYNPVFIENINENICKRNIIFNTIPKLILDKSKLILMNNKTVIIDLASKPGGVDFETAEKLGIKAVLYSGIPGKIASDYEAELIKEFVLKQLK